MTNIDTNASELCSGWISSVRLCAAMSRRWGRVVCVGLVGALGIIGTVAPTSAQTVTQTANWEQPLIGSQTFADVQAFTVAWRMDTGAAVTVASTCVNGTPIKCSIPITFDRTVAHTFTLTVANAFGSVNATASYAPGQPPVGPINITFQTKITVP